MPGGADVVVVGLGAAGAATLYQLARRGVRVTGIDRYSPPHDRGSSHGDTRITRLAVGEGAVYTPLVRRSHAIWREIEAETGASLLTTNGCLVIQDPSGTSLHGSDDFLGTTTAGARLHGIEHEELTAAEIVRRFPQFALRGHERGCFEASGGYVRPQACISAQLELAERHGATVYRDERVLHIAGDGRGVRVDTAAGTYPAARCVVAAGSWITEFLPAQWGRCTAVHPQTLAWFAVKDGAVDHSPAAMPVFIWAIRDGRVLYGIPGADDAHGCVKVGTEQFEHACHPDEAATRLIDPKDPPRLHRELVGSRLPGLSDTCIRAARCLYTTSPDMGFIVDRHPDNEAVLLVSACSGHGFKHSAGLGDAVAELLTTGSSTVDLSAFSAQRFAG